MLMTINKLTWPKIGSSIMQDHLIRWFKSIASPTLSVSAVSTKVKDLVFKGLYHQTLVLYKQEIHPSGLHAITSILPSVIKACSSSQCHHHFGLQLHCIAIKSGSNSEPVISNSIISMYAKFAYIDDAFKVFDTMSCRDTITWNSIVNCYIQNGYCVEALEVFKEMYACSFTPKPELIASVLSVCGRTGELRLGRAIHALVIVDGSTEEENSAFLSTALVDLHLRCHDLLMACRVFDRMKLKNEVSWTAMISGCIANQNYEMGVHCFRTMQAEGIKPNRVTLLAVLPACAELGSVKTGKEIHGYASRHGFDSEFRLSASLIHMYSEGGGEALHDAKLIFERTSEKDVVVWSSMIRCYSRSEGDAVKAMKLFNQMQLKGIKPNSVTLLAIISVCTNLSSLNNGCRVHAYVFKSGINSDIFIGNSLINMYSKCGCLMASRQIFNEMPIRDSVSWSALISAYGHHGCGEESLRLFHEMQERGMVLDAVTFLAIVSACNHAGLVEEGQKLFNNALKDNKILLTIQHYACHIDLLGRSGKLENACEVVSMMPMKPSMRIWSSLVSACKLHGRLEVAEMLAHRLIESEPANAANYTLLSMVYAESSNWIGVEEVRRIMRERGLKKSYGFSRIELERGGS